MNMNFVGLQVDNPHFKGLTKMICEGYMDYLELIKYQENKFDINNPEAHITIDYNETLSKGPNWLYWKVFIDQADALTKFRTEKLSIKDPVIDIFDNKDCRILKFNMQLCNYYESLKTLHDSIEEVCEVPNKFGSYKPHITIAYLKLNTPDNIIDEIKSKILLGNFKEWSPVYIELGGEKNYKFEL